MADSLTVHADRLRARGITCLRYAQAALTEPSRVMFRAQAAYCIAEAERLTDQVVDQEWTDFLEWSESRNRAEVT